MNSLRKAEAVGGISGAALAERESRPIEAAWGRLEKVCDETGELINQIYSRLQQVLTPEGPGNPAAGTQGPASSPLADAMFTLGSRVASSNEALRRLLERLEL